MAHAEAESSNEALLAEYGEVCKSHSSITEFRAKLLGLLPIASGAAIFLLLREQGKPLETTHLPAIGLFGFAVTVGLFLHELRGMTRCRELIDLGKLLEEKLFGQKLKPDGGQFTREHSYYSSRGRIVGTGAAAFVIYPTVLLAWLYVAAVGLWSR